MNQPFKPDPNDSAAMADPIDHLVDAHLAGTAELLAPSSGFVLSVMESVRAEASAPPPIAFPWRRVVPGLVAVLCGLIALVAFAVRALQTGAAGLAAPSRAWLTLAFTRGEATLCWVLLAGCLSIAAVAVSFRLAGRSR